MKIHEAAENYLETILMEKKRLGMVRSIDICNALGYSKPTISVAMKQLRESGHIVMDPDGFISLTDKGREIAAKMYERHVVIAEILIALGVDAETAYHDSCKIEHDISQQSFDCMKRHYLQHVKNPETDRSAED